MALKTADEVVGSKELVSPEIPTTVTTVPSSAAAPSVSAAHTPDALKGVSQSLLDRVCTLRKKPLSALPCILENLEIYSSLLVIEITWKI